MLKDICILGVNIHPITRTALHQSLVQMVKSKQHALILHANLYALNLAYDTPWLRRFLNRADILFSDGMGVILAARLMGHRIPERITYADWMWELAALAEGSGFSMFFLGGKPTVAQTAAQQLRQRFPSLDIVGTHDGYFDRNPKGKENRELVEMINSMSPNILVVGMGMPIQERWLMENWDRLDVNIALTGGAVFDYISGELPRAPRWVTEHGLEWLGRLVIEPRRLWKRYILGNPLFFWRLFRYHFMKLPLPD